MSFNPASSENIKNRGGALEGSPFEGALHRLERVLKGQRPADVTLNRSARKPIVI